MGTGLEIALITSAVSSAASGAVSYIGARNQAKAQEYAAQAAIEQGKVNAQIDVNNMVAATDQQRFEASQQAYNKSAALEQASKERTNLNKKLNQALASSKVKRGGAFQSNYSDVFKSEANEAYSQLAAFDFGTSQTSYGFNRAITETTRQRNIAEAQGLSARQFTLASAQNQATQFRNAAKQSKLQGYAGLAQGASGVASAYTSYRSSGGTWGT